MGRQVGSLEGGKNGVFDRGPATNGVGQERNEFLLGVEIGRIITQHIAVVVVPEHCTRRVDEGIKHVNDDQTLTQLEQVTQQMDGLLTFRQMVQCVLHQHHVERTVEGQVMDIRAAEVQRRIFACQIGDRRQGDIAANAGHPTRRSEVLQAAIVPTRDIEQGSSRPDSILEVAPQMSTGAAENKPFDNAAMERKPQLEEPIIWLRMSDA